MLMINSPKYCDFIMKLHTIRSRLFEQADASPDPFEPLPHQIDPTGKTDPEIYRLEQLKKLYTKRIDAIKARDWAFMNNDNFYHHGKNTTEHYVGNTKHLSNPKLVPVGQKAWGTGTYDIASLHPEHLAFRERYENEFSKNTLKQEEIEKAIKAERRKAKKAKEDAAVAALANSTAPTAPGSTLAPTSIPALVPTKPGAKGVQNPYVLNDAAQGPGYAGAPSRYKFTTQMQRLYNEIESALRRNGKTLATIYVGRPYTGYSAINFIATTTDSKFVWRKYDPGPGAGQNFVFLNGHKMNTSTFVGSTPVQQDALLKQHGVI